MMTEICLRNLPPGKFVRYDQVRDINDVPKKVVVWRFRDEDWRGVREAYFAVDSGEYLGEAL